MSNIVRNRVNHFFGQYTQSDDQALANNTGVSAQQVKNVREFLQPMAEKVQGTPLNDQELKEITERYHNHYIADMKRKYGFNDETMRVLKDDFKKMTEDILEVIKRDEPEEQYQQYKEYLNSYPFLYFNVIPREVVESMIAAKCVEENRLLRSTLADVTKNLSELVLSVSKLQVMTSVPPIARALFEELPDPLTANSDHSMLHYYHADMNTYYKVHEYAKSNPVDLNHFLTNPVEFLSDEIKIAEIPEVSEAEIKNLKELIIGLQTGKGCFPKGIEEWNHVGPEPPMDANNEDCHNKVRMGNPMNEEGLGSMYTSKKPEGESQYKWQKTTGPRF